MALVSTFFQMFIVLGMYNFAEGSKRESCSSNASDSSWMDITELDNKELDPKLRSNQKVGRNKWSSTKKRQKLSSTSNETANQDLHENQASNSNTA